MTAQIGDICKIEDEDYAVVEFSHGTPFAPKNYGVKASSSSTACWRGYWCTYAIENDLLLLRDLYLYNDDGDYPKLNGVEVSPEKFVEVKDSQGEIYILSQHLGHRVYENVELLLPYTGKLLLGKGFSYKYYTHMGFQKSLAYEELREIVLEEGVVLSSEDISDMAKEEREKLKDHLTF